MCRPSVRVEGVDVEVCVVPVVGVSRRQVQVGSARPRIEARAPCEGAAKASSAAGGAVSLRVRCERGCGVAFVPRGGACVRAV